MSKKRNTTRIAKTMGGAVWRSYVPGFFLIHLRYIRNYPIVWAALFVAPFIAIKMFLVSIFGWFEADTVKTLSLDISAIFILALCFYRAERDQSFRKFYILLAPATIFFGLIYWASHMGLMNPGFWVVGILIWLLSLAVWKISSTKGKTALSNGGNRKYAKARALYDAGNYKDAVPLLEKAAKNGHFKVLFLLGECHERGHYFKPDLFNAARYYQRASKKGYRPAFERLAPIYEQLSPEDKNRLEKNLLDHWFEK